VSAYDNDPRVTDLTGKGGAFAVTAVPDRAPIMMVRSNVEGGFTAWQPGEEWAFAAEKPVFPTADEAIRSLIGEPL
jgi:hypothetical protein